MKNSLLIVSITLLLTSCGSKKEEPIPNSVIPKLKLIDITTDIKLIEGAINLNHYNRVADKQTIDSLYNSVYNKYDISKPELDSSLLYYSSKPELLKEIYDSALVNLNKLN